MLVRKHSKNGHSQQIKKEPASFLTSKAQIVNERIRQYFPFSLFLHNAEHFLENIYSSDHTGAKNASRIEISFFTDATMFISFISMLLFFCFLFFPVNDKKILKINNSWTELFNFQNFLIAIDWHQLHHYPSIKS